MIEALINEKVTILFCLISNLIFAWVGWHMGKEHEKIELEEKELAKEEK